LLLKEFRIRIAEKIAIKTIKDRFIERVLKKQIHCKKFNDHAILNLEIILP